MKEGIDGANKRDALSNPMIRIHSLSIVYIYIIFTCSIHNFNSVLQLVLLGVYQFIPHSITLITRIVTKQTIKQNNTILFNKEINRIMLISPKFLTLKAPLWRIIYFLLCRLYYLLDRNQRFSPHISRSSPLSKTSKSKKINLSPRIFLLDFALFTYTSQRGSLFYKGLICQKIHLLPSPTKDYLELIDLRHLLVSWDKMRLSRHSKTPSA